MKKSLILALTVAAMAATSCSDSESDNDYTLRVLTFEDADAHFTPYSLDYCDASVNTWSDLVDAKQYGGAMLYGKSGMGAEAPYSWADRGNTELAHKIVSGTDYNTGGVSYAYWNGGHAISGYASADYTGADYQRQLEVHGTGGHNGSAHFAVHNGHSDNGAGEWPTLAFADSVERVIDHMWVNNCNYVLASWLDGDAYNAPAGDEDWLKVVATGYDAAGRSIGSAEFYLCRGRENVVRDWTRWELSQLGAVARLEFNVVGSIVNEWGLVTPAYFAYDDVAVRF